MNDVDVLQRSLENGAPAEDARYEEACNRARIVRFL